MMDDAELRERATYKAEPADGGAWTIFARTNTGAWVAIETTDTEERAIERLGELMWRDHARDEHGHDDEATGWMIGVDGSVRRLGP